jgi:hypothetical protein
MGKKSVFIVVQKSQRNMDLLGKCSDIGASFAVGNLLAERGLTAKNYGGSTQRESKRTDNWPRNMGAL